MPEQKEVFNAHGPGPVGFGAFLLVKFAGYAGAAQMLSKSYELPTNSWKVGGVRTVIGVAAGPTYFGLWGLSKSEPSPFLWFGGLFQSAWSNGEFC